MKRAVSAVVLCIGLSLGLPAWAQEAVSPARATVPRLIRFSGVVRQTGEKPARVAEIGFGSGPVSIQRYNQNRRVFVGADLAPGVVKGTLHSDDDPQDVFKVTVAKGDVLRVPSSALLQGDGKSAGPGAGPGARPARPSPARASPRGCPCSCS